MRPVLFELGEVEELGENAGSLMPHDLGGSGFTWYGGLIGGLGIALILRNNSTARSALRGGTP